MEVICIQHPRNLKICDRHPNFIYVHDIFDSDSDSRLNSKENYDNDDAIHVNFHSSASISSNINA